MKTDPRPRRGSFFVPAGDPSPAAVLGPKLCSRPHFPKVGFQRPCVAERRPKQSFGGVCSQAGAWEQEQSIPSRRVPCPDLGPWTWDTRHSIPSRLVRYPDQTLDLGPWTLDLGPWTLDPVRVRRLADSAGGDPSPPYAQTDPHHQIRFPLRSHGLGPESNRPVRRARATPLAQEIAISIQPQNGDSSKISFRGIQVWRRALRINFGCQWTSTSSVESRLVRQ